MERAGAIDLSLKDSPALEILARKQVPGVDAVSLRTAQTLLRVSKRILQTFATEFQLQGLSPSRYAILMHLLQSEATLAPSEIAERIGIARATVAPLIGALINEGLIESLPDPDGDGRRKQIRLSRKGRRRLDDLLPSLFAQMSDLVAPLTSKDRERLTVMLQTIESRLAECQDPGNTAKDDHDD